jgi:hypothetical protein
MTAGRRRWRQHPFGGTDPSILRISSRLLIYTVFRPDVGNFYVSLVDFRERASALPTPFNYRLKGVKSCDTLSGD